VSEGVGVTVISDVALWHLESESVARGNVVGAEIRSEEDTGVDGCEINGDVLKIHAEHL